MKYENTLKFLETRRWGKLAKYLEKTIGPRKGAFAGKEQVEADLTVTGTGNQIALIQAGLLVWISYGRPVNEPANRWGANRAAIVADFRKLSEDALGGWMDEVQTWVETPVEPPVQVVHQPVVRQPVQQPVTTPTVPPRPVRQPVAQPASAQPRTGGQVTSVAANLGAQLAMRVPAQSVIPARQPAANLSRTPVTATPVRQPVVTTPVVQDVAPVVPARPRRMSKGPGQAPSSIPDLIAKLEAVEALKVILIADVPLGHAKYLTEKETNQLAELPKGFLRDVSKPGGWLNLGKAVLTNKVGKCWSCAAAAIYTMVGDPAFDGVRIESVGATNYDHHFVVVNRNPTTDLTSMATWNGDAIIVDLWQANLEGWSTRKAGAATKSQVCWTPSNYTYKKATVKSFCAFDPKHRSADRQNLEATGKALHAATIATGLAKLQDCYINHVGKNQKVKTCGCSGWCDK